MISPTAEYALRAVVALAQRYDEAMTNPQLSEATRVPGPYLSKVLQTLVRGEIVRSQRGTGGGFRLARPPEEINVLEVVNVVDPVRRIRSCPLGLRSHGVNLCPLHRRLDNVAASMEQAFGATTIAELLSEAGPSRALCEK